MLKMLFGALTIGLILPAVNPSWADDRAEANAILDKAIQAAGGEAKLAQFRAFIAKGKGAYHEADGDTPITVEFFFLGPAQSRTTTVSTIGADKSTEIRVVNGDKGWSKTDNHPTEALDEETLTEEKEAQHLNWVVTLAPLKDKAFQLSPLGEDKVGDHAVVGIEVSHKHHGDVKLFFDKQSWLLLKTERLARDVEDKKDVIEEVFFDDYQDIQGTKQAMKATWKWDGKTVSDLQVTELKMQEKLDEGLFAKP